MEFQYNYDRMLVIGRSGSGKTYFVFQLLKHVPNYLVLTQKQNDYYPKNHIILLDYDIEESVNNFIIEGIKKAPITLVFEDLPSYIYSSKLPEKFRYVLINGRHIGIGMIFISQRYRAIPVLVRVQSNIHVYFQSAKDDYMLLPLSIRQYLEQLKEHEALIVNYDTGKIWLKK